MSVALPSPPHLRIEIGSRSTGAIDPGLPLIAGEPCEHLFPHLTEVGLRGGLQLYRDDEWLAGAATVALVPGLESATLGLYREILQAAGDHHLVRIWNYVPAINDHGPGGLENYQAFCRGRSLAFEQHLGPGFKLRLPAASAVGSKRNGLTVIFAAHRSAPHHVENPLQVPAYEYPSDYGPRSPSFARATCVGTAAGRSVFISGTSAVRGHATIAPESTHGQLTCTLENLRELSLACDLGPELSAGRGTRRHFKVYLRHVADRLLAETELNTRLLRNDDVVSYVQADICRSALNVEIEATIHGGPAQVG